jgi:hypothetical protein
MSNGQIAQLKRSRQPVYIAGVRVPSQLEYLRCCCHRKIDIPKMAVSFQQKVV